MSIHLKLCKEPARFALKSVGGDSRWTTGFMMLTQCLVADKIGLTVMGLLVEGVFRRLWCPAYLAHLNGGQLTTTVSRKYSAYIDG
jgi:hypothetical protein